MESIYKLTGRAAECAERYNEIQSEFEELMEENGGELTEEAQELLDKKSELNAIKEQIKVDILAYPDEYASWYLNVKAQRDEAKARRDAFAKSLQAALAKYDAEVKRLDRRMEWIKTSIADAMDYIKVTSLDKKSRPGSLHTLYFMESKSIEVDEALALDEYKDAIVRFLASLPKWLSFEPKIKKDTLKKVAKLPQGFERKTSRSLQIR